MKGQCMPKNADLGKSPIDGGFSDWQENWSNCSHACNTGIQFTQRTCTNPVLRFKLSVYFILEDYFLKFL